MSGIKKFCRFEVEKIRRNKLMLIIVAVILALILVLPTLNYFCIMPSQAVPNTSNRAETIEKYKIQLTQMEEFLSTNGNTFNAKDKLAFEVSCKKLRFLIDTNTIEADYLNSEKLTAKFDGRINVGFMFYFGLVSSFALWVLAIAAAAYFFAFDYHTHTLKNVFASKITRMKIFFGKLLLCFGFVVGAFAFLTLFALLFGIVQNGAKLLAVNGGEYYALNATHAFLAKALGAFGIAAVLSATTILVGISFKNIIIALASPTVIYGLMLLMYISVNSTISKNPSYGLASINNLPLLCLEFYIGGITWDFILKLAVHLIFAAATLLSSLFVFKKQNL